jgi:hypothetical protein
MIETNDCRCFSRVTIDRLGPRPVGLVALARKAVIVVESLEESAVHPLLVRSGAVTVNSQGGGA